eukprot:2630996-Pyramimonas_sp.AAC.1
MTAFAALALLSTTFRTTSSDQRDDGDMSPSTAFVAADADANATLPFACYSPSPSRTLSHYYSDDTDADDRAMSSISEEDYYSSDPCGAAPFAGRRTPYSINNNSSAAYRHDDDDYDDYDMIAEDEYIMRRECGWHDSQEE